MKIIFSTALALCVIFVSMNFASNRVKSITRTQEYQVDKHPGSSPYLTKDNDGNAVLSWVRFYNDSTAVLCYSVLDESPEIMEVKPSTNIHAHAENLPKVIFKPTGEIVAVWGARNPNPENKYSGLIFYSQSFDGGKTWTPATKLVKDKDGFDQRYSDVALTKNGEIIIAWLDNRKTSEVEGSAVYTAITEGRNGFTNELLVSQPACQCCRTSLFVDASGSIHILYRGIINDSIRDMVHVVSSDAGKTFSSPERIYNDNWVLRGCPHTGPSMTENSKGLHFAWYTGGFNKGSFYIRSNDKGRSFSQHDSINSLGMHPQITALPGGNLLVAWDESIKVGKDYKKRIGIQVRKDDGTRGITDYITSDDAYSTYPVLAPLDNESVVVAYSVKQNNKEYVKWQKAKLEY